MRIMRWITPLFIIMVLAGCSSSESEFTAVNSAQRIIKDGLATTIALDSGANVHFPAQCFSSDVTIMFADLLQDKDGHSTYYPTGSDEPEDLLAGVVVNTPADKIVQRNIDLTFAFREGITANPGDQFILYRFDYEDDNNDDNAISRWNRWGNRYATVSAATSATGHTLATVTLPSYDLVGYIGSLALFKGHSVPLPLSEVDPNNSTWIEGYVMDTGGNGISTDVGLYVSVGNKMYAADVINPEARTPVLPDANDNYILNGMDNTITSDLDGYFKFYIPENLIGQFVGIEFGHESATHSTEDSLYMLRPEITIANSAAVTGIVDVEANLLIKKTKNIVIRFGTNKVVSYPVSATN